MKSQDITIPRELAHEIRTQLLDARERPGPSRRHAALTRIIELLIERLESDEPAPRRVHRVTGYIHKADEGACVVRTDAGDLWVGPDVLRAITFEIRSRDPRFVYLEKQYARQSKQLNDVARVIQGRAPMPGEVEASGPDEQPDEGVQVGIHADPKGRRYGSKHQDDEEARRWQRVDLGPIHGSFTARELERRATRIGELEMRVKNQADVISQLQDRAQEHEEAAKRWAVRAHNAEERFLKFAAHVNGLAQEAKDHVQSVAEDREQSGLSLAPLNQSSPPPIERL